MNLMVVSLVGKIIQKIIGSKKYDNNNMVQTWANYCIKCLNSKLIVNNNKVLKNINWNRNVFVVSNHLSYFDIPCIIASTQRTFGFVAKKELKNIPFLKYWMNQIGCVFIDRTKYISAIRRLRELEKKEDPAKLVIFPEGTRSKNGSLSPFKTGVLSIAWQLDAILIPTVIKGTRNAWETRENHNSQEIKVNFFDIIDLSSIKKDKKFKEFQEEFEIFFKTKA